MLAWLWVMVNTTGAFFNIQASRNMVAFAALVALGRHRGQRWRWAVPAVGPWPADLPGSPDQRRQLSCVPTDGEVVERLPTILNIHYAIIVATVLVFRDVLSESTAVVTKDADICHQHRVLGAAVPKRLCGDHTERLSDASGGHEG